MGGGQELPTPHHFEQTVKNVTEGAIANAVVTGPTPQPYLEKLQTHLDAGFDHSYFQPTGPNQEEFIDFAEKELVPGIEYPSRHRVSHLMAVPPLSDSIDLSRAFFVSLGAPGLFAVAFLEFFLLPIPPDLVLIPLAAARPELALVYATVATAGSVSAGFVGYTIGLKGGRPALEARFSDDRIDRVEEYVDRHGFQALTFGAFAPIPEGYELLSIASGVFGLDGRSYLLASLAGRGGRYFLEAAIVLGSAEVARSLTEEELYVVVGVVALLVLAAYLLRKRWLPEHWRTSAE